MKLFNKKYSHGHGDHGAGRDPSHIEMGHLTDHNEYRDLNFKAVVQFLIALFATVAFSYLSMFGMMKVFQWEHEDSQIPLSPVADTSYPAVKPGIQIAPGMDLTTFRRMEDSILIGTKKEQGVIPIDQAIKEVAAEGLPYRESAPTGDNAGAAAETGGNQQSTPETTDANTPSDGEGGDH